MVKVIIAGYFLPFGKKRVVYFHHARTLEDLLEKLADRFPEIPYEVVAITVNQAIARDGETALKDGDTVELIPPYMGG